MRWRFDIKHENNERISCRLRFLAFSSQMLDDVCFGDLVNHLQGVMGGIKEVGSIQPLGVGCRLICVWAVGYSPCTLPVGYSPCTLPVLSLNSPCTLPVLSLYSPCRVVGYSNPVSSAVSSSGCSCRGNREKGVGSERRQQLKRPLLWGVCAAIEGECRRNDEFRA